ncbi:MAG: Enoyl-CoA hydratase _ degradation of branched-chain amino acids and alpha-keto acids, partial [uncultured Craurococcus sp.]
GRLFDDPDRDAGTGGGDPPQPAAGAERAVRPADGRARPGAARLRCRPRRGGDRHHRQRKGLRRGRRHQGDAVPHLSGGLSRRLHRQALGGRDLCAEAGDRGGRRLCARRRLRAGHDVRHDHRGRERQIRSAGDQSRRHPRRGRHAAADAGHRQGEGDGPGADRADDGRGRGGALRPRRPHRAGGRGGGGGGEGRREDRLALGARRRGGEGGGQPRLRDDAGRGGEVRAAVLPGALRHRGPEGGHGGLRGEAEAGFPESL